MVSTDGDVYFYNDNGYYWDRVDKSPEKMQSIHAGSTGVWALGQDGYAYYRQLTYKFKDRQGFKWAKIDDQKFTQLAVGGFVYGMTPEGQLLLRDGQQPDKGDDYVKGTGWKDVTPSSDIRIKQMDAYGKWLMVVTEDGKIYKVTNE